jgi:hypothetical protein
MTLVAEMVQLGQYMTRTNVVAAEARGKLDVTGARLANGDLYITKYRRCADPDYCELK